MKKIIFLLIIFSLLLSSLYPCFAITTYYMDKFEEAAGAVAVPIGDAPDTGWSDILHIDETNYIPSYDRYSDMYPKADMRFAYGENGLYFSADIEDEDFIFTTGRNEFCYGIDMHGGETDFYAWNGDVFIFTIDPANILLNSGLTLASDYQAWLCFGMTEDQNIVIRRTRFGEADLTDKIEAKGNTTENGWYLEACIPWDIVDSLVDLTSFGIASLDREALFKTGTLSKACVIFMDRYFDNETNAVETGNRLATLEKNSYEGALCPSFAPNPVIGSYGIFLYTGKIPNAENTDPLKVQFPDISNGAWYFDAVEYTVRKGIFKGMGNGNFEPDTTLTRAMFVSLLYRYSDAEYTKDISLFSDVPKNSWYTSAVNWAAQNKIVNGVGNGKFAPNRGLTRQEAVTILFRYFSEYDRSDYTKSALTEFNDAPMLGSFSVTAFEWATKNLIINGIVQNGLHYLKPQKTITRAETAQMMKNFAGCAVSYRDNAHPYASKQYDYIATNAASEKMLSEFGLYTDNSSHSDILHSVPIYNEQGFTATADFNACFSDKELIAKVTENILLDMEKNPDKKVFFLTHYDHSYFCLCVDCITAGREEGSRGGAYIRMLRSISSLVSEAFPENKLLIYISDFNLEPPNTPYPDNVILCARLNNRCFSHSLCDEGCVLNKNITQRLDELAQHTENFYICESVNSGEYYLAPLFALDSLYEDFSYYHSLGMNGYFTYDDDYTDGNFKDLYTYLRLCLLADPQMTKEEYARHIRVYLSENYGNAANEVRDYIDFMGLLQNKVHFSRNAAANVTMPEEFSEYTELFDSLYSKALQSENKNAENSFAGYKFIRQIFLEGISAPETYKKDNEELYMLITEKQYKWSHRSSSPVAVDYSKNPLYWN